MRKKQECHLPKRDFNKKKLNFAKNVAFEVLKNKNSCVMFYATLISIATIPLCCITKMYLLCYESKLDFHKYLQKIIAYNL